VTFQRNRLSQPSDWNNKYDLIGTPDGRIILKSILNKWDNKWYMNLVYSALYSGEFRAHVCKVMNLQGLLKVENFLRTKPFAYFQEQPFSTKFGRFISRIAESDWLTLKRK
jgi:hypothetical protein